MTQEEEDDFTRELAKMMISTNAETRKVPDRKPVSLDVGIPLFKRQRATEAALAEEEDAAAEGHESKGMQFTLLTKKGNKPQVRAFGPSQAPRHQGLPGLSRRPFPWRSLATQRSP